MNGIQEVSGSIPLCSTDADAKKSVNQMILTLSALLSSSIPGVYLELLITFILAAAFVLLYYNARRQKRSLRKRHRRILDRYRTSVYRDNDFDE